MRGETAEEFRARMEAKSAQQRYFAELEQRAAESQVEARKAPQRPKVKKPKPAPPAKTKAPKPQRELLRRPRPERCVGCGVLLYSDRQKAAPGAKRHAGHGKCWKCANPSTRRRAVRPTACTVCERPLRDSNTPAAQAPGSRVYRGHGMCEMCHSRAANPDAIRRNSRPERCRGCDRPLWSTNDRTPKAPGAVQHRGHGLCSTCYRREETR